jgi:hypothetical protein
LPHRRPLPLSLATPVRFQTRIQDFPQLLFRVILDGTMVALSHRRKRALVGAAAIPAITPVTIHGRRERGGSRRARREVDLNAAARGAEIRNGGGEKASSV